MNFKKVTTFIVTLAIVSSTFYFVPQPKKASAFLGIADFTFSIDIKALAREIADGIAMVAAQKFIDQTIKDTVDWAQNGFDGNPAYAVDPKHYLLNTSDQIAGQFIGNPKSSLSFLCTPFQAKIRIALRNAYLQGPVNQYSCTFSGALANIENFYNNFDQGGWDAWYSVSQTSGGNPYDAYASARLDLDRRITESVGLQQQELNWNSGFLSYKKCLQYGGDPNLVPQSEEEQFANEEAMHTCIQETTVTPGKTISDQLNKVLPADFNKLITANHVEQIVNAFLTGVLKRYVFSNQGLFHKANYPGSPFDINSGLQGEPDYKPDPCNISQDISSSEYCNQNQQQPPPAQNPPPVNNPPPPGSNQTYSVSGFVFNDLNQNGVYDNGDLPLSGESVLLRNPADGGIIFDVFTDNNGAYDIPNINPSTYRLTHTTPQGVSNTTDDSVVLNIIDANVTYDFGVFKP